MAASPHCGVFLSFDHLTPNMCREKAGSLSGGSEWKKTRDRDWPERSIKVSQVHHVKAFLGSGPKQSNAFSGVVDNISQ